MSNRYINILCPDCLPGETKILQYQYNTLAISPVEGKTVMIKDLTPEDKIYLHKCERGHKVYLANKYPVEIPDESKNKKKN